MLSISRTFVLLLMISVTLLTPVVFPVYQVLYSLYGVVEHSGRLQGGHYTAFIKVLGKAMDPPTIITVASAVI